MLNGQGSVGFLVCPVGYLWGQWPNGHEWTCLTSAQAALTPEQADAQVQAEAQAAATAQCQLKDYPYCFPNGTNRCQVISVEDSALNSFISQPVTKLYSVVPQGKKRIQCTVFNT